MLAHLTIIAAVKVKNFSSNFIFHNKKTFRASKNNSADRAFTSLAIAVITEFTLLLVVVGSIGILGAGIINDKSNYKLLKGAAIEFESKSISLECLIQEKCGYSPPDASVPVG